MKAWLTRGAEGHITFNGGFDDAPAGRADVAASQDYVCVVLAGARRGVTCTTNADAKTLPVDRETRVADKLAGRPKTQDWKLGEVVKACQSDNENGKCAQPPTNQSLILISNPNPSPK